MKSFLDTRQALHDPSGFISVGRFTDSPEQPERIARLVAGGEAAGLRFEPPEDAGLTPISAIHTPEYIQFLQTIYARWHQIDGAGDEVIPNTHPLSRQENYPTAPVGLAGYHQADTACPIGAHTWEAAYWSAQTAISGADAVLAGEGAYALCRPPGHHAYTDLAGGFCFFNNAAIAAERLRNAGHRVAILDVDVHHGNGTQGIFYARDDVLTVSLHADPDGFYPYYYGHAQERGEGAGLGYNLNLPLPRGSGNEVFLAALDQAFQRLSDYSCTALVVALGLDAHENDPFQGLAVTTPGFARIGEAIAGLGLPTLYVQEGGYLSDALGENLTQFLSGAMR